MKAEKIDKDRTKVQMLRFLRFTPHVILSPPGDKTAINIFFYTAE